VISGELPLGAAEKSNQHIVLEGTSYEVGRMQGGSAFNLIFDGNRMKKIGLEAWLVEQEERIRDGFHYHILQCVPCVVPTIGSEHDKD